jgi:raffinose/stachyose/melibiose transport system permease protein
MRTSTVISAVLRGRVHERTVSVTGVRGSTIFAFLAPALALHLAFVLYPVFMTFYNSFHTLRLELNMKTEFVGVKNFVEVLSEDPIFWRAARNSLTWAIVSPLLEVPLAFLLALALYSRVPLHRFFRTLWFVPVLMSYPVVGIIWLWIYNYEWGVPNILLRALGLGGLAQPWLASPKLVLPSLIVVTTWMWTGFNMVVLLAALHAVPPDFVEAARVDGASGLQLVVRILIPLVRPTIVNLMILSFIGKMKQFALVWVMTRGGPLWASETVATYVIKRAFDWKTLDLGYPSAIAVIWFIIIFTISVLVTRVSQRGELLQY